MTTKKPRKIHTTEFKEEAVKLANKIGVTAAAKQLDINGSLISKWRSRTQAQSNTSQREAELAAEVAKLKRQLAEQAEDLAILKKAATYFAKNQK
jgi:transposase